MCPLTSNHACDPENSGWCQPQTYTPSSPSTSCASRPTRFAASPQHPLGKSGIDAPGAAAARSIPNRHDAAKDSKVAMSVMYSFGSGRCQHSGAQARRLGRGGGRPTGELLQRRRSFVLDVKVSNAVVEVVDDARRSLDVVPRGTLARHHLVIDEPCDLVKPMALGEAAEWTNVFRLIACASERRRFTT